MKDNVKVGIIIILIVVAIIVALALLSGTPLGIRIADFINYIWGAVFILFALYIIFRAGKNSDE